jgi:hypothetical protein
VQARGQVQAQLALLAATGRVVAGRRRHFLLFHEHTTSVQSVQERKCNSNRSSMNSCLLLQGTLQSCEGIYRVHCCTTALLHYCTAAAAPAAMTRRWGLRLRRPMSAARSTSQQAL